MNERRRHNLLAACYLNARGHAFVLFEGPLTPIDWGVVEVRGKERRKRTIERTRTFLTRYLPDVLVLQDMSHAGTHRPHRVRRANEQIAELAERLCIPVFTYSRADVQRYFAYLGAPTKFAIAAEIAKRIPAFERLVPRPRKAWMREDSRMGIFDAAALLMVFSDAFGAGEAAA